MATKYTAEELRELKAYYFGHTLEESAEKFGRAASAIQHKAMALGWRKYDRRGGKKTMAKRQARLEKERIEAISERSKYGCMPNPLIFLEDNWRELARNIRLQDTKVRHHHWGTFVVGKGYNDD